MKKRAVMKYVLPVFLLVLAPWLGGFFRQSPIEKARGYYQQGLDRFEQSVTELDAVAQRLHTKSDPAAVQEALIQCRLAYKSIEFLAAGIDPEFSKDFLNGAPLPRIERNVPSNAKVLEPQGLQILDELIFSDDPVALREEIQEKTGVLLSETRRWRAYQRANFLLTDRVVFESARLGLIRLFTLGVTGFDTPASGQALAEAEVTLNALEEALGWYDALISQKNPALTLRMKEALAAGNMQVKTGEFDSFDRLAFLMECIQPLYRDWLLAHTLLGIETLDETSNLPHAVNLKAESFFDTDFLDPVYFGVMTPPERKQDMVALGKMLFFEPALSASGERSCASCHDPAKGFTDGQPKSIATGFGGTLDRNAPTLINAVFAERFFHDLRSDNLVSQFEHVLFNPLEFNSDYWAVFDKLLMSEEYVSMFKKAFPHAGPKPVNRETLTAALAAYTQSLVAFSSPFDQYVRGESTELDHSVRRGFNLFMGKAACGTCHFAPTFAGLVPPHFEESESEVLGVPLRPATKKAQPDPDPGRYGNGRMPENQNIYRHSFKTPTVRNIALTAPYMHNGAYQTLEQVMDFYNRGGGAGIGWELEHQTLPAEALGLKKAEIRDLIAFMQALTDTTGLTARPTRLPDMPPDAGTLSRIPGGTY